MTYEVVKTIGVENTPFIQRESFLVKIEPTLCRKTGATELYEVDHVIVEALRIRDGHESYEETHVVASDAHAKIHPAVLYLGTKALTVEEALFAIGQHNWVEHPEGDHTTKTAGSE